ncbi:homeobox protein CDX-2-like [Ornithodoros turicata]
MFPTRQQQGSPFLPQYGCYPSPPSSSPPQYTHAYQASATVDLPCQGLGDQSYWSTGTGTYRYDDWTGVQNVPSVQTPFTLYGATAAYAADAPQTTTTPDSGLAVSCSDVSGTPSPGGQPQQGSPQQRPAPARSPFEWMMKPAYPMQPHSGKTRTKDKYRVVYSDHQRLELEKEFHYSRYITIRRKSELAAMLGLSERQVKIWFQNRRAKERKQAKKRDEVIQKEQHQQQQQLHQQLNSVVGVMPSIKSEVIQQFPTEAYS